MISIEILNSITANFMVGSVTLLAVLSTYFYIKKKKIEREVLMLKKNRERIIYSLKHDFKIAAIAQLRALEILPKLEKEEQIEIAHELLNSDKHLLDMLNMLIEVNTLPQNCKNLSFMNIDCDEMLRNIMTEGFRRIPEKNIKLEFFPDVDRSYILADGVYFPKMIYLLIELAIESSAVNNSVVVKKSRFLNSVSFSISYKPQGTVYEELETVLNENKQYNTVGQGIKIQFIKKVLDLHNIKVSANADKNGRVAIVCSMPNSKNNAEFLPKRFGNKSRETLQLTKI